MAPKKDGSTKKVMNKGAWTSEEDRTLARYIEIHGAKKWKTIATKSGLNRCAKSCRLRWLNYLRPDIKRGNISDEEEDLIIRLHKLLGNRWSLIAGRLPGRTDNEIKNYWNTHLSKKVKANCHKGQKLSEVPVTEIPVSHNSWDNIVLQVEKEDNGSGQHPSLDVDLDFEVNELVDFSTEGSYGLDWVNQFLVLDFGHPINE